MGSTLLPFSQLIERGRRAWAPFKGVLRKADQTVFERLFEGAKLHVQAGRGEGHASRLASLAAKIPFARASMRVANQGKP